MLLFLTATDEHRKERRFSCLVQKLKSVFEFLNHIVVKGHTLVQADLIDENQPAREAGSTAFRISLPIEAFDGVSFSPALKQLEREWMVILAKPLQSSSPPNLIDTRWYRETLSGYEQTITYLELMITDVNRLYQWVESNAKSRPKPDGNPYRAVLTRYESQLSQVHRLRNQWLERVSVRIRVAGTSTSLRWQTKTHVQYWVARANIGREVPLTLSGKTQLRWKNETSLLLAHRRGVSMPCKS